MSAVLSMKNSINNVRNFVNDVMSSNGAYYWWIGRPIAWPDDTNPPAANLSYSETEQSIYHDLVMGKLITNNNISYLIPNVQWASNTIYANYDSQDGGLFAKNYYIVTSNYAVYKCIDNSSNSYSTIVPTLTSTAGVFQTSDGYTWKYMFTIPSGANATFTTNNYIPVVPNTYVTSNAIPGSIDVVRVLNGGANWTTFNQDYLNSVISNTTVILANSASSIDKFYNNCILYLKAGLGADQVSTITNYVGASKTITVSPPFNVYVNLFLNPANITGTWNVGGTVSQIEGVLYFLYQVGSFNSNDQLIQSDTGATGYVSHGNSTVIIMHGLNNTQFSVVPGVSSYPIVDTVDAPYLLTGTVSTTATSNVLTAVTANFTTLGLTAGKYIQVGANPNTNIRRIASVTNSTQIIVTIPFGNTLTANVLYQVNNAVEPASYTVSTASGQIIQNNLTSIKLLYNNTSSNSISYIIGETVKEYDGGNVDQGANATVSFVNTSTIILSSIQGVFSSGLFIVGQSSGLKSQISNIVTYPNVTLANVVGSFVVGDYSYSLYANGVTAGSATTLATSYSPYNNTQYIISPKVNVTGDGQGFLAYAIVNTASPTYPINNIVVVNPGNSYTIASANLTGNSLWGNNAVLQPVISPVLGHGYDPITELGARYAGVVMKFDTAANESYYFPSYGSYRRVGIIKNPLFQQLIVNVGPVQRANLTLTPISGTLTNGEIIIQPSTNAAAYVIYANTTFAQVNSINGNFTLNSSILGLTSNATSNVTAFNSTTFNVVSNNQFVYELNSSSNAVLIQVVNSSQIMLGNVNGKFLANTIIYDPVSNAYANAVSFFASNGMANVTATFGQKFDQTVRISLSSNNAIPFQSGEYVNQQTSNASGVVIDTTHELDMTYNAISGSISVGVTLTDTNTSASGVVIFANTSYIKLTGVSGTFNNGDNIKTITSNSSISGIFPVLVVSDIQRQYPFQQNYSIIGNTSGATGFNGIANTLNYPDLTRNTGDVIYVNDVKPFSLALNSVTNFYTILQF